MILISKARKFSLWFERGPVMWDLALGIVLIRISFVPPETTIKGLAIAIFHWLSSEDFDPTRRWIEPTELW